jgi:DNA repair protein RadC
MMLRLTDEQKITLHTARDVFTLMQPILMRKPVPDRNREYLWAIGLNKKSDVVYVDQVSMGFINPRTVQPKDIFTHAIKRACATVVLVQKQHPANLLPSPAYQKLTERLSAAWGESQIRMQDHVIITLQDFYSFADAGLLQ